MLSHSYCRRGFPPQRALPGSFIKENLAQARSQDIFSGGRREAQDLSVRKKLFPRQKKETKCQGIITKTREQSRMQHKRRVHPRWKASFWHSNKASACEPERIISNQIISTKKAHTESVTKSSDKKKGMLGNQPPTYKYVRKIKKKLSDAFSYQLLTLCLNNRIARRA